ncbi:MAG: hypothetical protein KAG72_15655 [Abyssibacter sp.]|nr:hypothetical protein [Abyssibacter sp.]MCK5860786.1 hypothetical protein [Abyssibacter sp.]
MLSLFPQATANISALIETAPVNSFLIGLTFRWRAQRRRKALRERAFPSLRKRQEQRKIPAAELKCWSGYSPKGALHAAFKRVARLAKHSHAAAF